MDLNILEKLHQDNKSIFNTYPWRQGALQRLFGKRLLDILFHFPTGLICRKFLPKLDKEFAGQHVTVPLYVHEHIKGNPYRIVCSCQEEPLDLVFFNRNKRALGRAHTGTNIIVSGKLDLTKGMGRASYSIVHPNHIGPLNNTNNQGGPEALYPLTAGVMHETVRIFVKKALQEIHTLPPMPEWILKETIQNFNWPSWNQALQKVHAPQTNTDISPFSPARGRLIYDELLAYQLGMFAERIQEKRHKSFAFIKENTLQKKLINALPFQLTQAQRQALDEINADMSKPTQMLRLMQGDVGSGKTIVALVSALKVIEEGYQAAILVPTDILSRQHFYTCDKFLAPLGLRTAILTGRERGKIRHQILEELESGHTNLLIGTHALIEDTVKFHKLGFVVIDEQHRFGVEQRARLSSKGFNPHILTMTATPIPRTLSLAQYGDMDISCILEKPACRIETETCVMPIEKVSSVAQALQRIIQNGEKVFWVCPLIEQSETLDFTAAIERYSFLERIFPNQVALVHGKLPSVEKEAVMDSFINGSKHILVATTVIEVGVDVPAASVMIIENAERFGLAQLHQLRGRIGRGNLPSTCILMYTPPLGPFSAKRLATMKKTNDGFLIAEADLKLRGRGEILGTRQSGMPQFRLCNFDMEKEEEYNYLSNLLSQAQKDARLIVKRPNSKQRSH
jgi:ATP-dependent DNA helicase RecG